MQKLIKIIFLPIQNTMKVCKKLPLSFLTKLIVGCRSFLNLFCLRPYNQPTNQPTNQPRKCGELKFPKISAVWY